ncbi:MAG: hypothetical protein JNJ54_00320 [Myxococcaceae bacterium]|nr:hypothetical protein [Myxococcaceae bacterium]
MKAEFRNTLWVALAAAALSMIACGPPPSGTDGGTGGGSATDACNEDDQCPRLFRCSRSSSTCVPDCTSNAQCSPSGRTAAGATALEFCPSDTSCVCDYTEAGGECKAKLCSADADCGSTLVCRSGKCEAAPAASTVTRCAVIPDFAIVKAGKTMKFWVSAWAGTEPVIIKEGATWTAPGGSPLSMPTPGTGLASEFTAGMTATMGGDGVDGVQAAFMGVTCKAKVIVVGAPANGGTVVVTDELTGRPVEGARVIISDATGAEIAQAAPVNTTAAGIGAYTFGAATQYSVSVFHNDYTYVTIANYRPAGGDANVLAVSMRRNPVNKFGGFKGTFDGFPMNPNIKAGVGGMSLAGAVTNLSLTQLLGPSRPTRIKLGTTIDMNVDVPDGAFLVFSETNKNTFAGLGLAGSCTDASGAVTAAEETKIRAGTCGTRSAWAFSGELTIGDLSPLLGAFQGGTENINIGGILGQVQPLIRKLNSSIARDVQFNLQNATCKGGKTFPDCTDGYDYTNTGHFTDKNLKWANIPLGFGFALKSGNLPSYRGKFADGALALTGVNVPGRGVIPLGLGAAVNVATPPDAILDKQETLPAAGLLPVRTAPAHSGVEGAEYGIIVAALSAAAASDASAQVGASALFLRLQDNKLLFDPRGATPIDISGQSYPTFPESGRFNGHTAAVAGVGPRSFKFVTSSVATALGTSSQVLRVSFSNELEHRWDVLFDAARAADGFSLPAAPMGFRDRLYATGMAAGGLSEMQVQALRLSGAPTPAGGPALSFQALVELNATNYDRITNYLTAFGFLDYGAQTVSFKTLPMPVPDAGKIVVKVEKFKLGPAPGDDGLVKLSFSTAMGMPITNCDTLSSATETKAGSGEVEFTVPAACMATGATVKAQLFYDANTPVLPEISVSQAGVTIN